MQAAVEFRTLDPTELARVAEIDRSEHIDAMYRQEGTKLTAHAGSWNSAPWDLDNDGEHSVAAQRRALEHYVAAGGIAVGAFSNGRLLAIGVVVPHLRPGIAQLAYLHVSALQRGTGIGTALCDRLDHIARTTGDTEMVVSATPTANTVRFYSARGFEPAAQPLSELLDLEPDDIHMSKTL